MSSGARTPSLRAKPVAVYAVLAVAFVILLGVLAHSGATPTHLSSSLPARRQSFTFPSWSSRVKQSSLEWYDFDRISSATRPPSNTIAPLHLRHLEQFRAPDPFRHVHVVSAWLDTRPLLAKRTPEIVIVASMQGQPFMVVPASTFPTNPIQCYMVFRHRSTGVEEVMVTPSIVVGLQDSHSYDKDLVTVMYTCRLEDEAGETLDWEDAEIFVTLSLPNLPPPADVFLPVTYLPVLNSAQHVTGRGRGGVCLPPLSTNLYAPVIRDFVSYYRALGFDKFYAYLLDPGLETLDVIREMARDDPSFIPIRWGLPKSWTKSGIYMQSPSRDFLVDPHLWDIPGLEPLPPDVEFDLGVSAGNERDVRIWYFGQHAAQQDCSFRAMADGLRWIASVDYDEYLLLRPADGSAWPLVSAEAPMDPFVDWARSIERTWEGTQKLPGEKGVSETISQANAEGLGLDVLALTSGMLPAGLVFQSSFMCVKCRPSQPPPSSSPAVSALNGRFPDLDWRAPGIGVPLSFASPVRMDWLPVPLRTKAVTDPWAWQSIVIHYPGIGYAEYATTQGFCSSSYAELPRSPADIECAAALVRTLGPHTIHVRPSPPTLPASSPESLEFGRGALFHCRVHRNLSADNIEFNAKVDILQDPSVISGAPASELFRSHRVDEEMWQAEYKTLYSSANELLLVEDWSMVAVMGAALLFMLEAKELYGPNAWMEPRLSEVARPSPLVMGSWIVGLIVLAFVGLRVFGRK